MFIIKTLDVIPKTISLTIATSANASAMSFRDKVVIVTGAGSGIGAATALKFASLSAKLALVDKDEDSLKKTLEKCKEFNTEKHLTIVADLSKTEDVFSVIPKTIERFGRIDVLVNCAGVITREDLAEEDVTANYELVMGVNLKAPIQLVNKAIPYLRETKGNIVNICSVRSSRAHHRLVMYTVSKAALEMFTKCMAIDLASYGVRVNCVNPGHVKTNIWLQHHSPEDFEALYEEKAKALPFGVIEPEEVASLIAFLANGEEARSITGSAYYIDGGVSLFESGILGGKFG